MHKILVVDDDEKIRDILEKFLTKSGFEIIIARGGQEAVEILKSDIKLDLAVLDMKMPKVNGMDVIQKTKKSGKNFPILFLTGSIDIEEYLDNLRSMGFSHDDILFKPVDLPELIEKIKKKLKIP